MYGFHCPSLKLIVFQLLYASALLTSIWYSQCRQTCPLCSPFLSAVAGVGSRTQHTSILADEEEISQATSIGEPQLAEGPAASVSPGTLQVHNLISFGRPTCKWPFRLLRH